MYDKNFPGGRGGYSFEIPSPLRTTFAFTHPCFCFWKDLSLNSPPQPDFMHLLLLPLLLPLLPPPFPLLIHHPFSPPPHKYVDHTLRCSAFYGVYNMSVVSVMFLYPSRNDGGRHRNSTLCTRVIHVP